MNALVRLIYASRATGSMTTDLQAIGAVAQRHNAAVGITGALVAAQDRYLQVLEGPRPAVDALYARIRRDPRHADCTLLTQAPADFRLWPAWSMGLIDADAFAREAARRQLDLRRLPDDPLHADHWIELIDGFQCAPAPLPEVSDER